MQQSFVFLLKSHFLVCAQAMVTVSRATKVELQVCLVHFKMVDMGMVQTLRLAIQRALCAAGSAKATVKSPELDATHASARANNMASHNEM